jgi:hypothetical protein
VQEESPRERRANSGKTPRARRWLAGACEQLCTGDGGPRVGLERLEQRRRRRRLESSVLVEEQAVAPARLAQQRGVVLGLSGSPRARDEPDLGMARPHRIGGSVVGGVVEHEDLVVRAGRMRAPNRVQAGEQILAPVGVHHAVGEEQGR